MRKDQVMMLVREALSDVLWVPPTAIDTTTKLSEYGLDSIAAIDLTVQLEEVFDIRIPNRDTPELITVDRIVDYVYRVA